MIEVFVQGITLDPITNMPIVVLKSKEGKDILPIWIGVFEANAIAMELENVERPRPMTHDLIGSLLCNLGASVDYIVIHTLKDNTYYADIVLTINGEQIRIDSRPSDAINIALRSNAPIYVEEQVLKASLEDVEEKTKMEEDEIKEWLESLKPEDFKKLEH
ncbi:MAG: bifunctional nuclease family protein [Aquificae bacterium]|nr:bifunctional nuclease family protein [Aquificota bacterium]